MHPCIHKNQFAIRLVISFALSLLTIWSCRGKDQQTAAGEQENEGCSGCHPACTVTAATVKFGSLIWGVGLGVRNGRLFAGSDYLFPSLYSHSWLGSGILTVVGMECLSTTLHPLWDHLGHPICSWQWDLLALLPLKAYNYIWPNPGFGRIWNFNLWWGVGHVLKNISDCEMIFMFF